MNCPTLNRFVWLGAPDFARRLNDQEQEAVPDTLRSTLDVAPPLQSLT